MKILQKQKTQPRNRKFYNIQFTPKYLMKKLSLQSDEKDDVRYLVS